MPTLRIRAFGLSNDEVKELEQLLKRCDDVENVQTHNSADDLEPGVIYASALHVSYFVGILATAAAGGAAKEAGKDIYLAAKERLLKRVAEWKARKDVGTPERIHLIMDDEGEMHIRRRPR